VTTPKYVENSRGIHSTSVANTLRVARVASALVLLVALIFNSEAVFALGDTKPDSASIQGVVDAVIHKASCLEGILLRLSRESLGPQSFFESHRPRGLYHFTNLSPATYSLEASLEAFKPFAKTVVVKENESRVENIGLQIHPLDWYR